MQYFTTISTDLKSPKFKSHGLVILFLSLKMILKSSNEDFNFVKLTNTSSLGVLPESRLTDVASETKCSRHAITLTSFQVASFAFGSWTAVTWTTS